MYKKMLAFFMLLILAARSSIASETEESFRAIAIGEAAPYNGFIFKPAALAKIYTKVQEDEQKCKLDCDTKVKLVSLQLEKVKEESKLELENRELLLNNIIKTKDKTILELKTEVEYNKWYIAGSFICGVVLFGTVVYISSVVLK